MKKIFTFSFIILSVLISSAQNTTGSSVVCTSCIVGAGASLDGFKEGTNSLSGIQNRNLNAILNLGQYSTSNSANYSTSQSRKRLLYNNSWANNAIIQTDDNIYSLENVDFDVVSSTFVKKNGDEVFSFNIEGDIKRIIINKKVFTKEFDPKQNGYRIYQIVFKDNFYTIYKEFSVSIYQASPDPYKGGNDEIKISEKYHIKDFNGITKKFNMNKKNLLKLYFDDKATVKLIKGFAKDNNLSFRDDNDIVKILTYSSDIRDTRLAYNQKK